MTAPVTSGVPKRGRHRAPGRGWGPRALLAAMAAPLTSIAGATAAVAAVLTDASLWAVPGAAAAGAPGLLHVLRRRRRERRLADRRARTMTQPVPPLVWEPVVLEPVIEAPVNEESLALKPVVLKPVIEEPAVMVPAIDEAVVPQPVVWGDVLDIRDADQHEQQDDKVQNDKVQDDDTHVRLSAAPVVPDGRVDTAELQAIWDAGEGPDTGELPVVPDAPVVVGGELVTEAPEGKQAVLVGGLTGTTQVLAPMVRRRSRRSTVDDRVFDALAMSMVDPLTRVLELPSESGRRSADTPVDRSAQPGERSLRALPSRKGKGRHVA
ncbi:MAG TPA: hypothetical protein VFX33_14480 [Actinomycetales bacterium]|nr:hypothetical protein [Actinomycetales bacterium]